MASAVHEVGIDVTGSWRVVWRPEMAPPETGHLEFAQDDVALEVRLTSSAGEGAGTGFIDGTRLTCEIPLDGTPLALEFEATVDGDQLRGSVRPAGPRSPFDRIAVLDGARGEGTIGRTYRDGSDAVADSLKKCGIEYVFGYLGGCVPAMHRSILSHEVASIAGRTELSAAWMSYGYNRVKSRAASAVLVWCVGAHHASPVVYAALQDSTPLLFMTMESAPAWDMRDILQDSTELYSSLKPISKYIKRLIDAEDLPVAVRQAVLASSTGKFGPSVLNLTHSSMLEPTTMASETLTLPSPPAASERDLDRTVELITGSEKPVILVGAGVHMAGAAPELRAFVEATGIPVVSSGIGGRGVLPDDHPLYAGAVGMFAGPLSGAAIAGESDLWIALGYSFSQTATTSWSGPKPAQVVHVDVEQSQIGRIFQPTLGVVADVGEFLRQMTTRIADGGLARQMKDDPRVEAIAAGKKNLMAGLKAAASQGPMTPLTIGVTLEETLPPGALVVGDEGFLIPGMMYSEAKYPNGMAPALGAHYMSLGAGLPAAIGAKLAAPERLVVCYEGDAGFYYSCADLSTLTELQLNIIVVVNNNGGLFGGRRASHAAVGPAAWFGDSPWLELPDGVDFVQVARGFGVDGERVETPQQLANAVRRAVERGGPYLLDVQTDGVATYAAMSSAMAGSDAVKLGHLDRSVEGSWPS